MIFAIRRDGRASKLAGWLRAQIETDLYLSVVTLGEIERGIRLRERQDPGFAADLRVWLDRTIAVFPDRVLDFTGADALVWGELSARIGHPGADLMIAAQALTREGAVVTGNVADFKGTGARLVDPF